MASFPDLRPNRRSAKAESTAAPGNRARLLLAVSTALLLTASLAVSELATLRGAKAHDASVFLTRELGPPLDRPLVRTPARATPRLVKPALGGKLEIRDGGLKVTSAHASVSLRFGNPRGAWRGHQHGVQRKLPFGSEAIVLGLNRVEQSLTVDTHQGTHTWRWRLDAAKLAPRLTADGTVRFADGKKDSGLRILPVVVFDKGGKDITPRGLRWSLERAGKTRWLQLRINDADLPLPYVIDPIALVAACPGGGCATNTATNATSVTVTRPASVATGSLMLAHVTLRNNDAITAPAGWTTTGNLRTSGATLEQRIYYRIATAADTAGTTYQWSWTTSSDGAAAILAYSGTDATNPIDVTPTDNAGSGTTATATGLTTTQDNDMIDALYGAQGQSGPSPTLTQNAGQSLTQEYAISSGSSPASKAIATGADGTLATAGATGNKTATISTSTPWVAHLVALMPPLAVDGAGTLTTPTTNVSASQTGNTITFTYTAAAGGMNNGSLTLVVPAGWTAPSTVSNNAGYTTASTGTVSVAAQTITVSSLTLAGGGTMTLTYGNTSGGGSGATATVSTGAQTWQAQQKARSAGTLTNLGSSPSITVNAANGSGTLTTPTSVVSASQTGRTITFTYTAATGGINNGTVTLVVPSGWTAPSTTSNNAGYTTSSAGTVSVASQTITVSSLTIAGGSTFTITYGDTSGGGTGATATATTGAQTWQAQSKSTGGGSLANLGASPSITVYAADGTGTLTTPTAVVSASQTGRTITFTYTAATGGINNGSVTLVVPAGWTAPSTTGANAGYTTASSGTVSVASQTITVSSLTIAGGSTFTITYGSTASGGPGATATSSTGAQTWQAQEKSTSAGSLANLGASPSITVYAADGTGTLTTPTSVVSASQTGRTITFTYTAATGGINNGSVTLVAPAGWTAPSTTGANPGYSTSSAGTLAVAAQTITVSSLTLAGGSTFTITYGDTSSGGPGATATSSTGAQTWQAQEKSTSAGSLANLGSSPNITVYAADGSGTLTTPTTNVSASQTGRTITFTYTAATGGINNGSVTLVVPAGWSAPSTTGANAGYSTSSAGTLAVASQTITVSSLTLAGGSTFTITYGSTAGGGPGATATSSTGAQTWQAQEKSTSAGSLANLGSSPSITVNAADGAGTLTTPTTNVSASQTGRTVTFTYTAPTGGVNNGSVTLVVPAGWSAPSTTGANAGYSTSSTGTLAVASQTITVSSVTLAAGNTFTITYGDTGSGGPGATATSSTGAQTWQAQEKSTSAGSLTNLGASPSITVNAADGSGTLTTPTTNVSASQTGRTIAFTYTAPTGGISNGSVTLVVPAGWSAPSTTGSNAGYTTATSGTVSVASQTITVSSLTLAAGNTSTITYGDTGSGGPGATVTSAPGAQTWQAQEKSTSTGSLTNLGASPSITVNAADGSGTLTTSTTSVAAGQTGRTITFTYTAATGGINNASVTLVVPAGWSAPSTTGANAGYSTSSAGTLAVAGQTITVSSLTLAAGNTFTIVYGSTGSGGPGATATSSPGAQTWQTQEKSTSAGSLANLGASPSITVYAADGSGTLTTPTTSVPFASTANTLTFTYTAATGGISNGSVTLVVPAGWNAPSTTGSSGGYTTSSAGTVSVASQTITVSSLTLAGGSTFTITYGNTGSGGAGATAPSSSGAQTWQVQEKSTSASSLANLGSSPSVTVLAADGSGTLTTPTGSVNSAATGRTITFTYTAATGGISNGSVTTVVPAGWSAPSTTGSNAGYTTSSSGTVSVAGQTITVSSLTLSGGSTLTITYGETGSGGPGATAPVAAGAQTWQAQEKSSSSGTLMNLAASPSITVNDPTAPSAPGLTVGSFTNASATGTTVYIRQGTAGGFTVTGTSSDSESGIDHLTFASGLGTGWTGGGADSSSPYASAYTFNSSATAPAGSQDVTATNGWALTSSATPFTVVADTTAPAVTAPTVAAGYYAALSVAVTKNGGTDGGSGVDNTTSTVQRDEIGLTNGSCGTFPSSWSSVTLVGGNDTTVVSGNCYRYRELLSDNVGNQGTSAASNTAKVDTTAPSTPSLAFGGLSPNAYYDGSGILYVRPSAGGTFTVTATSTDAQSGIGSYTFGTLNSNGGANFGGSQTGDHFDYTFGASTTAPSTARTVSSTNGAGTGSANATYSIAADTTAPSVTAPSVTAGYYTSNSVPVTKNGGTDAGANVDASSSTLERDTATLTNGACDSFPGSWSTVTLSAGNDTTVTNGHCYEYRELLSDHVGNQGTSSASNIAKVDSQGPANSIALNNVSPAGSALKNGSTVYYRGSAAGSFKLTNTVTDAESGPASSASAVLGGTTGGWSHTPSTVSTPSGGPYDSNTFSWNAGSTSTPTEVLTAADQAGNSTSSATLTFTNDSNAPAGGALTVNGTAATGGGSSSYSASGSFPIDVRNDYTETQSGSESGLASSTLTRASATLTANSCGSFGSASTITGTPAQNLSTGCYLYTLTGTDNVGNTVSITSIVKVDTSSPSAPSLTLSNPSGDLYASGTSAWFKPSSAGSFDLGAASSDGDTGIASYTFPSAAAMGASWSASGSGTSRTYSFVAGAAEPGTKSVDAANGAGSSSSSNFTVSADSTAPTTTIVCNAAACFSGTYYTSAPVHVTLSADDGSGSGVQKIRYTTDGTNPSPVNGSDYSGTIDVASTTTIKFRAYDNLGNEEAVGSQDVLLDGTPPNLSLTLAENPASGAQHVSGTTLFYRPGAGGGTFRVTATIDDPQTGVTSVDFPSVANVTGGGSAQTSSPYQEDYTWSAATTDATGHNVVAANGAGATTSVPFTLTPDSAAPTGQSITLTGATAPYFGSTSVTFSLGDGNDGSGAGIDTSTRTVTRESATLTGDACGTFSADAGTYTSPDAAVSTGHCYRYSFTVADRVGNVSSAATATAKVDTAAPTVSTNAPSALTGAGNQYYDAGSKTLFFRSTGAGSFSLGATASDTDTAVAGVTFPNVSGLTGWAGSTGGTDTSSPYSSPADYTWSSGAAEPGAKTVSTTDKAANSATDTITITDDTAAPTGQSITLTGATAPFYPGGPVTFSLTNGSDPSGGSGLDLSSAAVTRETGTLAANNCSGFTADGGTFTSPDNSTSSGRCYRYTFSIADKVGNVATSSVTAKVSPNAPTVSVDPPTVLTGSGNQYYDASTKTQFFRPGGFGSFSLNATADDADTGVTHVAFPDVSGVSGWSGSTGGNDTTSPYASPADYTWTSGATAPGARSIVATNSVALTNSDTITLAADSAGPTGQSVTLTGPTAPYYGSASVSFTLADGNDGAGAGLDASTRTVTRETGTLSGNSCTSFSPDAGTFTSPDTAVSAGHCYRYSFTIADKVGNVSSAATATAKVDTGPPTVSVGSPTALTGSGNQYYDAGTKTLFFRSTGSGSFDLNATASDSDTAVDAVDFPDISSLSGWSGSTGGADTTSPYSSPTDYSWSAGAAEPGVRTVSATDKAANSSPDTITIADDTSAPTGQSITLTGALVPYYGSNSVGFSLGNGSDSGGGAGLDLASATVTRETGTLSGDSCSSFSADAGTFTSPDTSVSNGHCYRYTFRIADKVANLSPPVTATAKVDTDNPTVSLTDPGTPVAGTIALSATASDPSTDIQQVVFERAPAGGSTWTAIGTDTTSPYAASWDTTAASDGQYDVRAVATDKTNNTNTSLVASRRVDNTAPATTIDATPTDPSNDTTPTFSFSSSEVGSTFECRVDGGSWAACSSPETLGSLGAGSHTFDVRATDTAGNTDATHASHTWAIDLTAPDTAIDAQPADPSSDTTPTFAFSSSEPGSTFECRIDGGSWTSCSSPDTISPALTEGSHTFDVRAIDQAGNTDPAPASFTWTVDLTAPDTTLDATPGDPSNDTTPDFSFSSSEPGSTFECRIDGGTWTACSSPHTLSPALAEGSHTFEVRATDAAGDTDASPASYTWVVDVTPPGTTIDSTPPDPSNDTTPTFSFSSSEAGSTYECRIDGGSWASCSSPETLGSLGAGSHTFDIRATDPAGNTDSTPASHTWTVDLTAPDTTIDSAPSNPSGDTTPTLAFSSSEPGSTFECRIDGGSWTSCSSPDTLSPALTEGSHTFDVRAIDQAGNTDATPASHTWIVDSGAPSVTITAPLTYLNGSDPNNYVVTATTPDTDVAQVDFFECSNASANCATGSWLQFGTDSSAPYAATWSTPAFDGLKSIRAVAVDAATNTGENIRDITIDRTAPTGVTVGYPNGYVTGSYAVTTNDGSDPDVNGSTGSLERRTGDLASNACSSYSGWAAATSPDTLASGKCAQYRYTVADNAGNVALATSANEVKSDTAPPATTLADPGANLRQTITLGAGASDTDGSGVNSVAFERRPAGGGAWTTIATDGSSPYSISFDTTTVADGLYDFRSVATDVAGNVETSPSVVANRRIDNTAPSATMLSPGDPVGGTVALTSNTSDTGGSGIATVSYELAPNGGSFNSQPASWDTTLLSDGLYDLRVIATDVAGNTKTSPAVTTRVDNTPPALNFTSPATGSVVTGTVSLVGSATDASPASPPITFAYKLHSDPPSAYAASGSSWNTALLPAGDGLYDLRARATDDAANTTNVENTSIRVDNAPPTVAITAPAAAINGSLPSPTTFAANASDPAGSGVGQVEFFECTDQSNDCSSGVWSPLGTVPAPGPYSVSWAIPAADGNHALAAVATDNAGHTATATRNVDVDRTAPNTSIVTKPADPSNGTPSFTFTSTELGSTFECSIDGGGFAPCTSPHTVPGLTDNSHTFQVRATDAAGNTDATPDSWTWHRDTNAPSATLSSPGNNVRQVVTLTSAENDPPANGYQSGIASVAFEYSANSTTWASIGTNTSPPFDNVLWNTALVADGVYQLRIIVSDAAGNSTTDMLGSTIRIDNTPPTTSQNDPGQYLRATKTLTGSASDTGSGIDHVDFERAPTGGGSWTTIATDSTPGDGFQASFDTTSVSDGHYDFRTVAYDVAGNQAAATPVTDRLVDNTPPDANISSPGAYLRGAVNLTSSTSDPGGSNASGVVTVAYEYSTNGGSTWQSTGSNFNSSAVPDGNVDLHVVATDAAGNVTTSAAVTSFVDNTKPSTTDNAPSGWQSTPVTVTLNPNDGGSGVNVTEYSVDGNPSYTVGTSVVIPAPADGSNDGSHTIAYFSVDNAGNIETIKSTTVLIDATPPTCPSCAAADYLRGTVDLSADPDTTGSGVKSVTFEYTDAGGSTWTAIGTDTTGPGPYTASWDTTPVPDGHYDLRILITDNADNVTTTDLPDKVVDNTAPDVALVGAPTEGQLVSGTIGIAASASDATSPVASVKFYVGGSLLGTDSTAPFSLNWNTTTGADGGATIQVVVEDMAGNTTTSAVRTVSVDNVSPTPTLADPGQYLNGTVSLSASSDPDTTQVDFERRTAGGGSWVTIASDTTTPWGTSLDTTALADGLYDFRAIATDGTGHTGTSPIRANARVDNAPPAGSLTSPAGGATVGGPSVTLSGSYSDAGSGIASAHYELRPTGSGSWTTIAISTSAPFSATWDATTVASGSYDLQPVLTDRAGNTFTGTMRTITVDVSAPTVVLANPGATISGSVTLNATVTGSGATQVAFATSPAGGASWSSVGTDTSAPWSATFNTSLLPDGVYDIRATVSDSLGNTSFDTVTSIRVDNTAPRVLSSTPAEGSTVSSANAIGLVTSEPATPLNVTLDGGATVAPVVSGTHIDFGTGTLSPGAHTLSGELQDSSGKRAPFRVHFTVWSPSGSSLAPPVNKNTSPATSTTVESADGFAAATMPAGAWSTSGGDWLILRITPVAAPSGLTNGFGSGPEALDVTARWALAGTEVHQFTRPIGILMRTTEKGLVPATFENGQWRVIARVPSAGTLPAGWDDGFWTDGAGFHLLTRHLSVFALLHDLQAPNAPQNVRGYLGPTGLTLRWTPGSDNSGTYDFVTVFSDSTDTGHYGVDYTTASMGSWSVGDPRIFRLKETDLAGNESQLTRPLRPVPSLIGKTPDQIAALLAPLGMSVGSITYGGTGPAGTVTGPANLVLAEEGGSIDLIVSQGGAGTRLAFKVVTAPRIKPAKRRSIGARVMVTRASRVTAQLFSPRRVKLYTWRFSVKAGRTIVKLRLPRQVRRTGVYTMRWTARSGRETVARKLTIRLVRTRARSTQPVQVLLAGGAATSIRGNFTLRRGRVVSSGSIEPTFDAAANRRTDVHVIVVDVDQFGVGLISDLHAVFPSAKLVALTSSPKQMVNSLRAGASIALPRSTPAPTLVRVIQRLLGGPAKPVRSKPAKRHTAGGSRS